MNTRLSSKGQVIIPKAVRDARGWKEGTELVVEEREDGVLLRPAMPSKRYTVDDVYGVLKYEGPAKTIEEMNKGIDLAMRERWAKKSRRS